ncbi:MAG: transporter substrate-binding domain-containing protein [Bacteroidetes bacterium]|nr:transporter substrate-binding domain-containing protein [Bacteroidota bacterium]
MKKHSYIFAVVLLSLLFILLQSCSPKDEEEVKIENLRDNKLVAITGYNAYSYFIYKGQPMGFEYELVKKLAKYFNVDLEVKIVNNIEEMFEMLNSGKGDLIAFNLTITKERLEKVDFTKSINTIKQVLVQRKPENWEKMKLHEIEKQLIRDPAELIGKTVFVRSNSAYVQRLINLSDEIGGDINVVKAERELTTEDLIAQVSSGEIDYTISDDNIAHLNSVYYRNIDAETDISLSQRIAWAVEKDSDVFESAVNKWLDSMKATVDFAVIYKKYFTNRYAFKKRITSEYFSNTGGGISKYDDLIKKYSELVGWDWRLSASLVYQESQFNPNTKSWAGAVGLMQLMPNTAKQFGITNLKNPEQNINGGFKYLTYLDNLWKESITDSTERIKFVLASYNVGPGHITDARNLTEKYEGDPDIWFDNVEVYLKLKSKPKYYNDEVVKRGYARGKETVKYVKEILERYEQYKQLIK